MIPIWVCILFMVIFILVVVLVNIYVLTRLIPVWTEKLIKASDEHYDTKVAILIESTNDVRERVEVLNTPYSKGVVDGIDKVIEMIKLMESDK